MTVKITKRSNEQTPRRTYKMWDATVDGAKFAVIVEGGEHGYEVIWADRSHYYSTASFADAERRIREKAEGR